jgi:hypothetical protein
LFQQISKSAGPGYETPSTPPSKYQQTHTDGNRVITLFLFLFIFLKQGNAVGAISWQWALTSFDDDAPGRLLLTIWLLLFLGLLTFGSGCKKPK